MWLASDFLLIPSEQGNQILLSVDLLTLHRRNILVASEDVKVENLIAEPLGVHFGILSNGAFYLYKIDGVLLQEPLRRSFIAVIWLRSGLSWMPKDGHNFIAISSDGSLELWAFNGTEYTLHSSAQLNLATFGIVPNTLMVKTLGERTLLFLISQQKSIVFLLSKKHQSIESQILGEISLPQPTPEFKNSKYFIAWDHISNQLTLVTNGPREFVVSKFDVNTFHHLKTFGPFNYKQLVAKHQFGGLIFKTEDNRYFHLEYHQCTCSVLSFIDSNFPILGINFSSHGNTIVVLRPEFHEIFVLALSDDPNILAKSLVVKTLISSSLGLDIIWPVKRHLLSFPLTPLIKAIMTMAGIEKIGLSNLARIYSQICLYTKSLWFAGHAYFDLVSGLDIASQEFISVNTGIAPIIDKILGGDTDVFIHEVKLALDQVKCNYFLALISNKLLKLVLNPVDNRIYGLFGLASFRKRLSIVLLLCIASIYDSWDQSQLNFFLFNNYIQTLGLTLQSLYQAQGHEAVSLLALETIFDGKSNSLTELVKKVAVPPEFNIDVPCNIDTVLNRSCRLCGINSSPSDTRPICYCGGQIK